MFLQEQRRQLQLLLTEYLFLKMDQELLVQLFIKLHLKGKIMSLIKTTNIDQITVTEDGTILYREATRIIEDGNEISKSYHRNSLSPSRDLTGVPANVVAICNVAWTPEVIAAYQAQVAASQP